MPTRWPGPDAALLQEVRELVGAPVQLAVGQGLLAANTGDGLGHCGGLAVQTTGADKAGADNRSAVAFQSMQQQIALGGRQQRQLARP